MNKITRQLNKDGGVYLVNGQLGLCPEFVQFFLPKAPPLINVSVSQHRQHRGRVVWVRINNHMSADWSWRKGGKCPTSQTGMFFECHAAIQRLIPGMRCGQWYKVYVNITEA